MAYCGYCVRAQAGRTYPNGSRRTRPATGASNIGLMTGRCRGYWQALGRRPATARQNRHCRMLHRRHVRECQIGGAGVGKTKRGKGSKLMAVPDRAGLPIAVSVGSASPHEVTLDDATMAGRFIDEFPERLICDRAYDSDPLDERMAKKGIEMIAPHKRNPRKPKTQDGRALRRHRRH